MSDGIHVVLLLDSGTLMSMKYAIKVAESSSMTRGFGSSNCFDAIEPRSDARPV